MRKIHLLAAALAVSAAPAVFAAGTAAKAAPAPTPAPKAVAAAKPAAPSPEEVANIQRGVTILRLFNAAFQAKEVQQPVKTQLFSCLYRNNISSISAATKKVLDQNPTLKQDDASVIYRAAAGVCGIAFKRTDGQPDPDAAAVPGAPGAPAAPKSKPEGR